MPSGEDIVWEYGDRFVGEEVQYTSLLNVVHEVVILELDPENDRAYVQHENERCQWVPLTALSRMQ